MAISVTCECGRSAKAKNSFAGKVVACPECGRTISVPSGPPRKTPGRGIGDRVVLATRAPVNELFDKYFAFASEFNPEPGKFSTTVVDAGLTISCAKCSLSVPRESNGLLLAAGADPEMMNRAIFLGPNVAALGRGKCPRCGENKWDMCWEKPQHESSENVLATDDPSIQSSRPARMPSSTRWTRKQIAYGFATASFLCVLLLNGVGAELLEIFDNYPGLCAFLVPLCFGLALVSLGVLVYCAVRIKRESRPASTRTDSATGVCDVCSQKLSWSDGYVLNTAQVTTNPAYWEFIFTHQWSFVHETDPDGALLPALVNQQGGQTTGWCICETCAALFEFDRAVAKQYALQHSSHPPGWGPASGGEVGMAASRAWKSLYGEWPPTFARVLRQQGVPFE